MRVHSLENLNLGAPEGHRLVVLGDPVAHSLSPAMHNAALAEMTNSRPDLADWRYEAVHVPAADLSLALPQMHAAGVAGINLTLPHKVQVLNMVEEVDTLSRGVGAVNTLVRTATGYRGTNTDVYGIIKAIEESFDRTVTGQDVWIFGAGGAARGIIIACLDAGADRITVVNRSVGRLHELEKDLKGQNLEELDRIRFYGSNDAPGDPEAHPILINATSLGLKEDDPSPVDPSYLLPGAIIYDSTYGASNRLCRLCREAGLPYADGLSMLVWQGVRSLEIWTGESVPASVMRKAAEMELEQRNEHG